jgi:hypothetical protein
MLLRFVLLLGLVGLVTGIDINLICKDGDSLRHYTITSSWNISGLADSIDYIMTCMEECFKGELVMRQRSETIYYYPLGQVIFTPDIKFKLYQRINKFTAWETGLVLNSESLGSKLEACVNSLSSRVEFWRQLVLDHEYVNDILVKIILLMVFLLILMIKF